MDVCGSYSVTFGVFRASLINVLLAQYVRFRREPTLFRFVVVLYSFLFVIIDLMVLAVGCLKFKILFDNPTFIFYFSTTLSVSYLLGKLLGLQVSCLSLF